MAITHHTTTKLMLNWFDLGDCLSMDGGGWLFNCVGLFQEPLSVATTQCATTWWMPVLACFRTRSRCLSMNDGEWFIDCVGLFQELLPMATTQCTRWMWWEWWSEKMTKQSCFFIQVVFPVCWSACLSHMHAHTPTHSCTCACARTHTHAHAHVHAHMHTYVYANDRGILIVFFNTFYHALWLIQSLLHR